MKPTNNNASVSFGRDVKLSKDWNSFGVSVHVTLPCGADKESMEAAMKTAILRVEKTLNKEMAKTKSLFK